MHGRQMSSENAALYAAAAKTLDEFFDKWPWGFTRFEMASVLRAAYPGQLEGTRPLWTFVDRYVGARLESNASNKLSSSLSWQIVFYLLLTLHGGRKDMTVPTWAKPTIMGYRVSEIIFYGRKQAHLWARFFFECRIAAASIKRISKSSGIRLLQCLMDAKGELTLEKIAKGVDIIGYSNMRLFVKPQLEALQTRGLVDAGNTCIGRMRRGHTALAQLTFKLSALAAGAFQHITDLEKSDKSIRNCPFWCPMFVQIRKGRSNVKRSPIS